ncbi:heavy metal-associated isoprenylated plant protein 9-like [Triticum dicoccoides]|uniref:heavy metal-associated isoprenylated plant protein 9-like n=1 Tax=Triticum dicoccoides TaxID=85692 RepID=UPI000E7B2C5E|nr:heavy metal-associated isoprenylated plant protein 9-like [Triticum dicoccoides]
MGEQVATKEEANNKEASPAPDAAPQAAPAPAPAEEKKDEAAPPPADQDPNKEEPPADPPSPPPPVPVILGVEVHCTGCAKRIRRSLLRCKGVETVHVDMPANQVTIKGAVDPQALCDRLRAKTKRDATLISPLPPPPPPEGEEPAPPPPPPAPLVSEARTVELLVNMHCEACSQQLQTKMMRMKGVVSAQTDLAAGRLTLSTTVQDDKIVEYIHRRTGKIASVVPPPSLEPPKEEEPPAAAAEPSKEEAPADADGKKEEAGENKPAEDGKAAAEAGEEKKEGGGGAGEEDQKPGKQEGVAVDGFPPEEMMKRMVYWPYGGAPGGGIHYKMHPADAEEAMMARRMAMHAMPPPPHHHHHNPYATTMMHQQWAPPPPPPPPGMPMYNSYNYGSSYMMERPPQMFSDENPNACVIS